MPRGIERINERTQRPNANINFIKPLATSSAQDQQIATDFLDRIAAQCYPVMKKECISVMALEEYPPNKEFLGRNFNAGEVIQLVLKDRTGRWLSFRFVQMVMMHELAHCKQMNHSRFFWQVRNQYADQVKGLWDKGYVGEGIWGRGKGLATGRFVHDRAPESADIPEHLCGGTYRRARGKKRKRGQDCQQEGKPETYAERQQRRIARKFGKHGEGQGLGEDDLIRGALEQGRRCYGKPRVAQSKRGRELRANAALARFEAAKNGNKPSQPGEDDGSETESDDEDLEEYDAPSLDQTGPKITDDGGHDLYRVCGDEDSEEAGGTDEMEELKQLGRAAQPSERDENHPSPNAQNTERSTAKNGVSSKSPSAAPEHATADLTGVTSGISTDEKSKKKPIPSRSDAKCGHASPRSSAPAKAASPHPQPPTEPRLTGRAICSLENSADAPTCIACAHVLHPALVTRHWRCKSEACKGSKYINAGDAGRCGLCAAQRVSSRATDVLGPRRAEPVGNDVLRWD